MAFKKLLKLHTIIAGLPGLVLILTSLFCSHNSCCKLPLFIIIIRHAICLWCNIETSIGNFDRLAFHTCDVCGLLNCTRKPCCGRETARCTTLTFQTPPLGWPLSNFVMNLIFATKLGSCGYPSVKEWRFWLCSFWYNTSVWQTDGRTFIIRAVGLYSVSQKIPPPSAVFWIFSQNG